ncbi:MAG: c-type cytochrome [Kofleriaceae bacterium]
MLRLAPMLVTMVAALAACSKNSQPPDGEALVARPLAGAPPVGGGPERGPTSGTPPPMAPPPTVAAAPGATSAVYLARCAGCHGAGGAADGPMAAAFPVRPRSFVDAAWQASVTDAQIADIIVRGSAAVGKSPSMPAQADLATQPEVVSELVKTVRGFAPAR